MRAVRDASTPRSDADEILRRGGLRVTAQRVLVLDAMMREAGDATAQALHERLRHTNPTLGLATVYRTLGSLADAGILDTMQHGHGVCYRWCAPGHHHHLTCTGCHRVVEVRDCEAGEWVDRVARVNGFEDVRHSIELVGTCAACRVPA